MLRLVLAWAHLLALGIGLGAVWARARALAGVAGSADAAAGDAAGLRRAFTADAWWGAAAGLWIATGLWRLFAGTEKATGYYLANHAFWGKMGLLLVILALEAWPMATLIRWRAAARRGNLPPTAGPARRIAAISYAQAVLVALMVAAAVAMARGYGGAGAGGGGASR